MAYIMEGSSLFPGQGKDFEFVEGDREIWSSYHKQAELSLGLDRERGGGITFGDGRKFPPMPKVIEIILPLPAAKFHPMMHGPGGICLSQEAIDVIEAHEPDIHQYCPIKIHTKDKQVLDYFILNVCVRVDALDVEKSGAHRREIPKNMQARLGGLTYRINLGTIGGLRPRHEPPYRFFVFKDKIKGHALWAQYGVQGPNRPFISDALHADLKAIGAFKGGVLDTFKVGEV